MGCRPFVMCWKADGAGSTVGGEGVLGGVRVSASSSLGGGGVSGRDWRGCVGMTVVGG